MTGPEHTLRMEGMGKTFSSAAGPVHVLRGVNLTVCPGDFVAVTGPSGSGKTTLLHLAALLDRPTDGRLLFRGEEVSRVSEERVCALRRDHIGMIYQQFHLLPRRTALENVAFRFRYMEVDPRRANQASLEALERVGLDHLRDRAARLLSGGEMQRVAIARAIAVPPTLLLADEPTGNLDHASSEQVMACLEQLHRAGLTVMLATHSEDLAGRCTRRLCCDAGHLREAAA